MSYIICLSVFYPHWVGSGRLAGVAARLDAGFIQS